MSKDSVWLADAFRVVKRFPGAAVHRYRKLNIWGKAFIWFLASFYIALAAFIIIVTPARIAQFLYDLAQKISNYRFGWFLLCVAIVGISFPPCIGHTTIVTLCGFAYGMKGFLLAAPASSIGSAIVFVTLRQLFSKRLRRWSATNDKWQALEAVIHAKGLPLIILIRTSPMPPWVYSNALFASIEAVSFWQFLVATLFVYPKVLLHVFIGSRAAALSDGDQRKSMDTQTKVINGVSIASGILLGFISGGLVYYFMKKQIRTAEGVSPEEDELAEEAIDDIDEGAPLLRDFSDEERDKARRTAQISRSTSP